MSTDDADSSFEDMIDAAFDGSLFDDAPKYDADENLPDSASKTSATNADDAGGKPTGENTGKTSMNDVLNATRSQRNHNRHQNGNPTADSRGRLTPEQRRENRNRASWIQKAQVYADDARQMLGSSTHRGDGKSGRADAYIDFSILAMTSAMVSMAEDIHAIRERLENEDIKQEDEVNNDKKCRQ